jgi:hypothetical protein
MATTTNNGWTTPDDTDLVKDGALAIRDLGQEIDTSVGEGLLAWQSWAPTLGAGWANGNGVWDAFYCQIGKTVIVYGSFVVGSTTTKGSNIQITLPVAGLRTGIMFTGRATISGVNFLVSGRSVTGSVISLEAINAAATYTTLAQVTSTVPATWVTGSGFTFNLTYEAA